MAPIIQQAPAEVPPTLQKVLDKLEEVSHQGGLQYKARCPAHDDRHASLSVKWGDKGKVILNCHAECEYNDITKALGLGKRDLEQPREIVARYVYEDEDGESVLRVSRDSNKGFFQEHWNGKRWQSGKGDAAPVPYRLPALAELVEHGDEDDEIWIVEGEKDVEAIEAAWGDLVVATCNAGGAGKWTDEHSAHFEGFKGKVVVVPDNDDKPTKPGQKHALAVYESITRTTDIESVELVYSPFGKDAADAVGSFGPTEFTPVTPDELREEIATAAAENPDAEAERAEKIEAQTEWLRVQREARARLAAEGWEPPTDQGSWAEQKDRPDEEVRWLIPQLAFEGANVVVNAQAKSGKTSLILNVAHSLLSGDPLFGHFEVAALPEGRSVAWWNAELFDAMAKDWLRDYDLPRPEAFFPLHLRGYAMPFDVAEVEEWAVAWLKERGVAVWLIDPLSALYTGEENSNTEMGAWLGAIDRIKRRAGVETVFLVHHVAEASAEENDDPNAGRMLKGRGASRLTGWADVLWSYSGRFDEPRYIAALGRDVDLPQFGGLTMNGGSRMLRWNGQRSTPSQDRRHALALTAYDKVAAAAGPLTAGGLQALLPGAKADPKRRAIAYAVEQRWLTSSPGRQNATLYGIGEVDPRRFKIGSVKARIAQESDSEGADSDAADE